MKTIAPANRTPEALVARLQKASLLRPKLGIVLGSAFESVAGRVRVAAQIPYDQLPGFPRPAVPGHQGMLLLGYLGRYPVLVLSGRAHFYEGYPIPSLGFPVQVLAQFGIRDLLLTNAAGAVNRKFAAGDFMAITDHINFMGDNPLRGTRADGPPRFLDLTNVYDAQLVKWLQQAAAGIKLRLHTGVYVAVAGPCFETPAEVRMFRSLGADAVGMSTVPEAIMARACGLTVAGLSCLTNAAAGSAGSKSTPITHAEVLEVGRRLQQKAGELLMNFVQIYHQQHP